MIRPSALLFMAAAAWLAAVAPALATVEDPMGLLGVAMDKYVDTGLKNMNAGKIDVLLLRAVPADADGMARFQFQERHMGPDGGVILIGTETDTVGAYLGSDYTGRGVTPELVQRFVKRIYKPEVKNGERSDAILALVREIKLARTLGRDPDITPVAPPPKFALPWWWYIPPVAFALAGLGGWLAMKRRRSLRRRARLRRLVDRLEDLQYQLKRLAQAREQLAEAGARGESESALAARDAKLEGDARELERLAAAVGARLKQGDWEAAEAGLDDAEKRTFPLACGLAAALAAHQARLGGESGAAVLERGDRALARWNRLAEARASWAATTAGTGSSGPQQLGERLEGLAKVLTRAPLDVAEAEDFLDATEAIYSRALSASPV